MQVVEAYKREFEDRFIYYIDTYRSEKKKSVAFSRNDRDWHKYRLGMEVLCNVYTLAACGD